MGFIYTKAKKAYYFLLELFTLGRGVKVKINGFQLKLPSKYYRNFPDSYENENFEFFAKNTPSNAVVLDIGAHIGLYAIFFAKKFNAKVYSFEPSPATQKILKNVIEINNCEKLIMPTSLAISDKPGKAKLFINNDLAISVSNSLIDYNIGDGVSRDGSYEVDLISIDDFVNQHALKVDVLKIDAEGVELEVLRGAAKTFLEQRPIAIMGLHPFAYDDRQKTLKEIWDILIFFKMKILMDGKLVEEKFFCNNEEFLFDVQLIPE